jgi:hypothetical protein
VCAGPRKKKYGSGLPRGRRLTAVLLATVGLLGPLATAPALAELQIHANEGLLTLAVWNWTPYYLGRNELKTSSEAFNPSPFWTSIWPYQQTGISFSSASSGTAQLIFDFEIQDDKSTPINNPVFTLEFNENTTWDIKAAADLLLHQAKSGAVSWSKKKAKSQFQDPAKDAAKEAATATAAEFGLEEVKVAVKVFKEIGKIFNALDPHRRVKLDIYTPSKNSESDFNDVCLNRSTDNATQRVVGPPGLALDWSTADRFYVVTAGSVTGGQDGNSEPSDSDANKAQPGMIDMAVTPLCDFVCGAYNGIATDLIEYSQSDCTNAQSDSTALSQYTDAKNLLVCLQNPYIGLTKSNSPIEGVYNRGQSYLVPPTGSLVTYNPDLSCTTPESIDYLLEYYDDGLNPGEFGLTNNDISFCGQCVTAYPTGFTEPEGSWPTTCDLVTFDGSEFCANCGTDVSSYRGSYSCTSCPTNQYGNSNGQLFCE